MPAKSGLREGEPDEKHELSNDQDEAIPLNPRVARSLKAHAARRVARDRQRATIRLSEALKNNRLLLHFDPQFQLANGTSLGAEALLRMQHHRRGIIPPYVFLKLAERHDVGIDVILWMVHQACTEAASWPGQMTVAVALSDQESFAPELIKKILIGVQNFGQAVERLELQLACSSLNDDDDELIRNLGALHRLGVHLTLRDFGISLPSFSLLKRLPFTKLKLPRSLVHQLPKDLSIAAVVRAAVAAGHSIGFSVLADGVETVEQYQILKNIGCHEIQGPYVGLPLSSVEFQAKVCPHV